MFRPWGPEPRSSSMAGGAIPPHSAGHPIDHRGENAVLWHYPERIRQIDALCDEAELRGIADGPPELACLGWGLGRVLWILERARLAEATDAPPAIDRHQSNVDLHDTLPSIASLLHLHAQMRRRGVE